MNVRTPVKPLRKEKRDSVCSAGRALVAVPVLVVLGLTIGGGCASEPDPVPVKGSVRLDGKPTAGISVAFIPTDETRHRDGKLGIGYTADDGSFTLKNPADEEMLYEGEFKVTFARFMTKDGKTVPLDVKPSDAGAIQVLPPRYLTPTTTPFTVEVSAVKSSFEFDLDSKDEDLE